MEEASDMSTQMTTVAENANQLRARFHNVLMKANKEHPRKTDIEALRDLLEENKEKRLWKAVMGMGELAESQVLDTIVNGSGQGMRECWSRRLKAMRADLGYGDASALERLLIQ